MTLAGAREWMLPQSARLARGRAGGGGSGGRAGEGGREGGEGWRCREDGDGKPPGWGRGGGSGGNRSHVGGRGVERRWALDQQRDQGEGRR